MKQNNKLKLFISYSHLDNLETEPYIEQFKNHIFPLKEQGLIEEWYDREILPGKDFQPKIDSNLEDADIICLFVSANFLSSGSCIGEIKKAFEFRTKKNIPVISIILSPCGWLDDDNISKPIVLPTDGKPVSVFDNRDAAWMDVYDGLKRTIEYEVEIRNLELTEDFKSFLQNTEMLTKAHSQKESVFLDDIFIPVELDKFDFLLENEMIISSEDLLSNILEYNYICIAGDNQSGKTTLCKKLYSELRDCNFIPVYVSDKKNNFVGKINNYVIKSLQEQYQDINIENIDEERIVPIIDDFYLSSKKSKHIKDISDMYSRCVIVVDDIYGLNIEGDTLTSSFTSYMIKQLRSVLRYKLIKKWLSLTDKNVDPNYKEIDKHTALIDATFGKTIGKGIMPAYPFFVLSTIMTNETFSMSLNQEITSQGYCYQAFIYYYLRRHNVKNDEIDIYINYLTELAFHIYNIKKEELNLTDFANFMESYSENYNLPIETEILLVNLREIVFKDSLGNFTFRYPYFYYFFVAKYISEHMNDSEVIEKIDNILHNLHVDENAYIAVFLTHHSRNSPIISKIEEIALSLFDKYKEATLTKDEMHFFDEHEHKIIEQVLPPANINHDAERTERLNNRDELEQISEDSDSVEQSDDINPLEMELRRAIKTVEVIGCIIRNRAGSLKKPELERLLKYGMNVHLRILSNLFELIGNESNQEKIVELMVERLDHLEKEMGPHKRLPDDKKREYAKVIFWNLNFLIVCGIIHKIIHSLGSDKLTIIVDSVCDEVDSPVSFLVKHGISMTYNKNLQINELQKGLLDNSFSEVSKRAIKFMVADYCAVHPVNYRDRQKIKTKLRYTPRIVSNTSMLDE